MYLLRVIHDIHEHTAHHLVLRVMVYPPPPDISATPSPWDFTIDDCVCKGTAGSGGF